MQDQFNLYVKLMEECGETIHAAAKVLKRGRHGVEKYILSEECGDVLACIDLMESRGLIDIATVYSKKRRTISKYEKLFDGEGTL
jgi:NTP pyrophosphatase (non-canonical NTP hydrolase)|tara:strand:+ start:2594 stop:2848 length:255 start_codon:yes stop_codon:yes gene_type:complete